jgi:hypothetical protein
VVTSVLPTWRTSRHTVVQLPKQMDTSNAEGVRLYAAAPLHGITRKVSDIAPVTHLIPRYGYVGSTIVMAVVASAGEMSTMLLATRPEATGEPDPR